MWRCWLLVLLIAGIGCTEPQESSGADPKAAETASSGSVVSNEALGGNRLETSQQPLGDEATAESSAGAYDEADEQLNQTYQSLKRSLDPAAVEKLVAAQQAWIRFRDAECRLRPLLGSSAGDCLTAITRDRTRQLEAFSTGDAFEIPDALIAGLGTVDVDGTAIDCSDPQGTPSLNYCTYLAYERDDNRLNQVYQSLKAGLDSASTDALTDAQFTWIHFRDAHCLSAVHEALGGTGYSAYYAACQAKLTQERTDRLLGYGDLL